MFLSLILPHTLGLSAWHVRKYQIHFRNVLVKKVVNVLQLQLVKPFARKAMHVERPSSQMLGVEQRREVTICENPLCAMYFHKVCLISLSPNPKGCIVIPFIYLFIFFKVAGRWSDLLKATQIQWHGGKIQTQALGLQAWFSSIILYSLGLKEIHSIASQENERGGRSVGPRGQSWRQQRTQLEGTEF